MIINKHGFLIALLWIVGIYFLPGKSKAGIRQVAKNIESVYLHLSEDVVMAGQRLWFQTYLTSENQANASKVVYVELLNSSGQQISGSKLMLSSGTAKGEFLLPDSLSTGWYLVSAYTQWMRNFPESEGFRQPILVINPNKETGKNISADVSQPVYFYPEGSNFVQGVDNHMVFRMNPALFPEAVQKADILEEGDSMVITARLSGNEWGDFYLNPKAGKTYSLRLVTTADDTILAALPAVATEGFAMQVNQKGADFHVRVQTPVRPQETLGLQLQAKGNTLFNQILNAEDTTWAVNIPTALLSESAGQILLVNQQGKVLAKRMVYAQPQTDQPVRLSVGKEKFLPREQVELQIQFANGQSETTVKNASLSVRKVNPFYNPLASGQFPVRAEPPVFLNNKDKQLLNGWLIAQAELTNNERVLSAVEQKNQYPLENEGLLLSGTVTNAQGNPLTGRTLLFSVPGTNPQFDYYLTNQQGKFSFPLTRVFGRQEVILQLPEEKGYKITLDEKFAKSAATDFTVRLLPFLQEEAIQQWIATGRKRRDISQIYNLYTTDSTNLGSEKKGEAFRFYGAPNFAKNLDDFIALPTFEEVCRELMPGVQLKGTAGTYHLDIFDVRTREFLSGEPALLIDGVPVFDVERLVNMPPDIMARIETVNRRTYYGEFSFNGTAAIYSSSGTEYQNFLSPDVFQQPVTFLEQPVLFSSIFPESEKAIPSRMPDFRTLLYWQPDLKPNEQGEVIATFYTADETGQFEAVVSGITQEGKPFVQTLTFEVGLPAQE